MPTRFASKDVLSTAWVLALAFVASLFSNGFHVASEHHDDASVASSADHDDDDHDHDHDDHRHDAHDHKVEARPASSPSYDFVLAPLPCVEMRAPEPDESPSGPIAHEPLLPIPEPLGLSQRTPRAPPLG